MKQSGPAWFENPGYENNQIQPEKNLFLEDSKDNLPPPPPPDEPTPNTPQVNANWWELDSITTTDNFRLDFDHEMLGDKEKKLQQQAEIEAEFPDPTQMNKKRRSRKRNSPKKERPKAFKSSEEEDKKEAPKSKKKEEENPPIMILEAKSPAIWTYGIMVILFITFFCELWQQSWIESLNANPLIGPSINNALTLGAKYGPLILDGQFWRLLTANFLHLGLVQLVFSEIVLLFASKVEKDGGYWRTVFIFLVSGTYGWILSCIFSPNMINCGASGGGLGLLMVALCDLATSWKIATSKGFRIGTYIGCIVFGIIFGLFPFLDNWSHFGGMIIGFLCALMLIPNLSSTRASTICHGLTAFLAFPAMSILYSASLVFYFRSTNTGTNLCQWCQILNCINIRNWCTSYTSGTVVTKTWP